MVFLSGHVDPVELNVSPAKRGGRPERCAVKNCGKSLDDSSVEFEGKFYCPECGVALLKTRLGSIL
ncbi:MAG: hypothetical protein Kow0069_15490 [Promethearchaeota archaeon]